VRALWKIDIVYLSIFLFYGFLSVILPNTGFLLPSVILGLGVVVLIGILRRWARRTKLKKQGISYKATVFEIVHPPLVFMARWTGGVLVQYVNENGERCTVEVKRLMLRASDKEDYMRAMVYIDPNKPKHYEVEVFRIN